MIGFPATSVRSASSICARYDKAAEWLINAIITGATGRDLYARASAASYQARKSAMHSKCVIGRGAVCLARRCRVIRVAVSDRDARVFTAGSFQNNGVVSRAA